LRLINIRQCLLVTLESNSMGVAKPNRNLNTKIAQLVIKTKEAV